MLISKKEIFFFILSILILPRLFSQIITNEYPVDNSIGIEKLIMSNGYTTDVSYKNVKLLKIDKSLTFKDTTLNDKYFLKSFKIYAPVSITSTIFEKSIYSQIGYFNNGLIVQSSHFKDSVSFELCTFDSIIYFFDNIMDGPLDFYACGFPKGMNIINSTFKKITFENCYFKNIVNLAGCDFGSYLSFKGSEFRDTLNFVFGTLPDTLDFSFVLKLNNEIDLTLLFKKSEKCLVNLLGTDLSKIKINTSKFKVWFPEEDSATFEQKASVYENLLVKFKKDGFNDSYKDIDIEFKELKYKNSGLSFVNFLEKYWWNYGYNKERILLWSIVLLLFYSLITMLVFNKLRNDIYVIDLVQKKNFRHNTFLRFYYSLIYTALIFFGIKLNIKNFKTTNGWFVYIVFIYLTGLVCTAYIINLIVTK